MYAICCPTQFLPAGTGTGCLKLTFHPSAQARTASRSLFAFPRKSGLAVLHCQVTNFLDAFITPQVLLPFRVIERFPQQ